jgi:hypothetical protein
MPIVATARLSTLGGGSPSPGGGGVGDGRGGQGVRTQATALPPTSPSWSGIIFGDVLSPLSASFQGTVSRDLLESLSAPSIAYTFAVKLADTWIPSTDLLGPLELDESLDTIATRFSFGLVGRRWSIQLTETTWTSTPVEVWVTAGPIGHTRTWRRAFGFVLTCEQLEGIEPTLRVKCGDPSRLYDRTELCYELPADAGLTQGEICAEILTAQDLTADIPAGALYRKPVITDSQKLWSFLAAFGEPETWSWRFTDWNTVTAQPVALREPPEPPDDVWTLRDVLSIESAPPADVPSQWIIRSTQITDAPGGITINRQRAEVFDFYAVKKAVAQQLGDGTHQPLPGTPSAEVFQRVSAIETETHERAGVLVAKITRQWGLYNPRAAKLRTPSAGDPPGPVEGGYYWAQAWLDEDGAYRAWPKEAFVKTGERREVPSYDADGTETGRRIDTLRWYSRAMGTRSVGSAVPNVVDAGVGDDDRSWYPFERALTSLLRIEDFGRAQVDQLATEYNDAGAAVREIQETSTFYSPRTAVTGVPWYLNYSGAGQKDLLAPFQRTARKVTTNNLTEDGLLAGTVEQSQGFIAPKRIDGAFDWGDQKSNVQQETWGTAGLKTTAYNILDESSYEELVDDGTGARPRLVMGRAPRPRYRQSTWTTLTQQPIEVVLEDGTAAAWWGPQAEVLTLDYLQSLEEAHAVAKHRRSRRMAITHTVIRPICQVKPGATVHLIDPRTGIHHRCLVTRLQERWAFTPRPQILATYTLEQPL